MATAPFDPSTPIDSPFDSVDAPIALDSVAVFAPGKFKAVDTVVVVGQHDVPHDVALLA